MKQKKNNNIKEMRNIAGMTQKEFAAFFGIPLSTLQDWEHGRRKPPVYVPDMMKRILKSEKIRA